MISANIHNNLRTKMTKYFYTSLSLLLSFTLLSQEIDESFIASLPDDLRQDFLSQSLSQEEVDFNYRNPDTRVLKLEEALREAERSLNVIRSDISPADRGKLERFGDRFFKTYQSTFLPINEPNVNNEYVLDSGDIITLQLVGRENEIEDLRINRDGSINIPSVGNVLIAGLTYSQAVDIIQKRVQQAYAGIDAYITLSDLRDMNVLIVGNVFSPGMYTLSGGSSPMALIYAAGGINDQGSFRYISHKRNNELLQNIDLYQVFINGNLNFKHQLRSGDVIVVHPKLSEVRLSGAFANQAIYEINSDENLSDLLEMAGARTANTSENIIVERLSGGTSKKLSIPKDQASNTKLFDADSIELLAIEPIFNKAKVIEITGEVKIPGFYTVSDDMKLSDLLSMAGLYTENAYPLAGVFTRESVKDLEKVANDKGYNELIRYLVSSPGFAASGGAGGAAGVISFLSLLKQYQPTGRIVTEFEPSKLEKEPKLDRVLEDKDRIHIPAFMPEVFVFGEVMNPGAIIYQETFEPYDYINRAGSFSRVADESRMILISPNGESTILTSGLKSVFKEKHNILPGSVIYVPRLIGRVDGINLAASVAPIISSFALSIASLNSINN